ncbi:MAG: hydrogenase formation protein HypD [Candidatus Hodarchaeota archaeon]
MIRFDKKGAFSNKEIAAKLIKKISEYLGNNEVRMRVMHVCGTHERTIASSGIRSLLPSNVEVICGPGCPVCVCHTQDIYKAMLLADEGHIIATFGDMVRVPSERGSLMDLRAKGKQIEVVYAISDAIKIAKENPGKEVIFFAVGFETFAPVVANALLGDLPPNFSFLCSLKTIPPIMELLLSLGNIQLDGFITPGHVSTIIGTKPYDLFATAYKMPIVTAGFQPNDILLSLMMIAKQIHDKEARNENEYKGVVREEGNPTAISKINEVFEETKVYWRGIGPVPEGGYKIRESFTTLDANQKFSLDEKIKPETVKKFGIPPECSCHLVIMGQMKPDGCPLFKSARCNPQNPIGPCMVAEEGTCRIAFEYQ